MSRTRLHGINCEHYDKIPPIVKACPKIGHFPVQPRRGAKYDVTWNSFDQWHALDEGGEM